MKGESFDPADLAASFQKAVVEVLVGNSMKAAEELGISKFAIAGRSGFKFSFACGNDRGM